MYERYLNNYSTDIITHYDVDFSSLHYKVLEDIDNDIRYKGGSDYKDFKPFDIKTIPSSFLNQQRSDLQKVVYNNIKDLNWRIFLTVAIHSGATSKINTSYLEKCTKLVRKVLFDISHDFYNSKKFFVRPAISSMLHFHCLISGNEDLWIRKSKKKYYPFPILDKIFLDLYCKFKFQYFWRHIFDEFKLKASINIQIVNPLTKDKVVGYTVFNRHKENGYEYLDVAKHFIGDSGFFFHTNILPKLTKELTDINKTNRLVMKKNALDFVLRYEAGDIDKNDLKLHQIYLKEKQFLNDGEYKDRGYIKKHNLLENVF